MAENTHKVCPKCGTKRPAGQYRMLQNRPRVRHDVCMPCERSVAPPPVPEIDPALAEQVRQQREKRDDKAAEREIRLERKRRARGRVKAKEKERRAALQDNDAAKELARRELARRSLVQYILQFNTDYQPGWVHEDICRRLERFLDDVVAGKGPRLMLSMPPRHGKLCADSTPVLTLGGWKTHGELRPGDSVFGPDGQPTEIIAVSPPDMASLEVEFTNGAKIKTHPSHEWVVFDRPHRKWRTMETWELAARALTSGPIGKRGGRYLLQLPLRRAVEFPERALPIAPYMLGVWLGDGRATHADFCYAGRDSVVLDAVVGLGYSPSWQTTHGTTGVHYAGFTGLRQQLRALGVLGDKHIPSAYSHASLAQRLELLAGLVDTDGHVEPRTGRVRITTVSDRLRDGVMELLRGLGWEPYCYTQAPTTSTSGVVGKHPVHYVGFQPTYDIPTRIERKQVSRFASQRRLGIAAVRQAPPEKGRCIQVAREDGLYLVGRELVPTHNSTIASQEFPSWALGKHAELEVIACSYGVTLPIKFSRRVRERLRDAAYQQIFEGTRVDPESQNVEGWSTTAGGGYQPAGVGGGITGKGSDILICDDPFKDAEEADSETVRQGVWDWWGSTAYTRLSPQSGVIVINTRWHDDDLSGRLLQQMASAFKEIEELCEVMRGEGATPEAIEAYRAEELETVDQWEVISYPALAEHDEYLTEDHKVIDFAATKARPLRKKGEALHPARYPLSRLRKIKRALQPRHWSALYQQNPVPDEGTFFTKSMIHYAPPPDWRDLPIVIAGDLAISKKDDANFTVLGAGCVDYDDRLHLLDVIRARMGTFEIVEAILDLYARYKSTSQSVTIGIERGQLHLAIWPVLEKRMQERKLFPSFDQELKPITDKRVRARPLQGLMQHGQVCFAPGQPWTEQVIHELLRFDGGVFDDCVDMMAWMARMRSRVFAPKRKTPKRLKSWKDKLSKYTKQQAGAGSAMAA